MPYTNPLDATTPLDTDLLSAGDDSIRELKAAIRERLLTAFVDVDADPLQLLPAAIQDNSIGVSKLDPAAPIHGVLFGTKASTLAVPANGSASETLAVPGAVVGDIVVANFSIGLLAGALLVNGWVSAADTVTLQYVNPNASAVSVDQNINVAVIQAATVGT